MRGLKLWLGIAVVGAAVSALPAGAAPPPNDSFAAAWAILDEFGSVLGTTAEASKEAGERNHAGLPGGRSVWYRWTTPVRGEVTISTCDTATDTTLGVYRGDTIDALEEVGSNDNSCGAASLVRFMSAAGVTYSIAVDTPNGAEVAFRLRWSVFTRHLQNTSPPSISGTLRDGETLTAHPGTWTGTPPITYEYYFECAESLGPGCGSIGFGTNDPTFLLRPSEVGAKLRVRVVASNDAGRWVAYSAVTPPIAARVPVALRRPTIQGVSRVGETLIAEPGEWDGTPPITTSPRWQRCRRPSVCADIRGAVDDGYDLQPADRGATIRVVVAGSNAGGSVDAASTPTAVVRARSCIVPRLRGKTLAAARRALARAGCTLGKVKRARGSTRRNSISGQSVKPGKRLKPRAPVGVVLSLGRRR